MELTPSSEDNSYGEEILSIWCNWRYICIFTRAFYWLYDLFHIQQSFWPTLDPCNVM
jgi:hypothetical protein